MLFQFQKGDQMQLLLQQRKISLLEMYVCATVYIPGSFFSGCNWCHDVEGKSQTAGGNSRSSGQAIWRLTALNPGGRRRSWNLYGMEKYSWSKPTVTHEGFEILLSMSTTNFFLHSFSALIQSVHLHWHLVKLIFHLPASKMGFWSQRTRFGAGAGAAQTVCISAWLVSLSYHTMGSSFQVPSCFLR